MLTNGVITYTAGTTTDSAIIVTVATHTCISGFALIGAMTRTCMDDDQGDAAGVWNGSPPSCERKNLNQAVMHGVVRSCCTVRIVCNYILYYTVCSTVYKNYMID